MTTTLDDGAAPPVVEAGAPKPSPESSKQAKDVSFVAALEAVDAFLEAQEQLASALRDAHHALSRAKYALASSGGGATLPLRRPPPPVDDDDADEVRAERWVELVRGGCGGQKEEEEEDYSFELRAGPVVRRKRREGNGGSGNGGDANEQQPQYDDPRSPPPTCPEAIARADSARLKWAGASGALPPPALRDAQARFGAALAAAVQSASAALAVVRRAERVSKMDEEKRDR